MKYHFTLIFTLLGFLTSAQTGTTLLGTGAGSNTNSNFSTYLGFQSGISARGNHNIGIGYNSTLSTRGSFNIFLGNYTGLKNTYGQKNIFIGFNTGKENSNGSENVFIGNETGGANKTGSHNTMIGSYAGFRSYSSSYNTFIGRSTGYSNITGERNTYCGAAAGSRNETGSNNTCIGFTAGFYNTSGSNNVFIGYESGKSISGSNKLSISNTDDQTPLIYGEFDNDFLQINGKMCINTNSRPDNIGTINLSTYGLYVKGGILTEEVRVRTGWADYVFDKDYELMPLQDLEKYIEENNHLPNVPSADVVENEGIDVGNISKIQQEKIEELTLYIIQLRNELNEVKEKLSDIENTQN